MRPGGRTGPLFPWDISHLTRDISLSIVGAWVFALVARFIRLPVTIAYLAAGVLLGPVGFGWIADRQSIETIAELGLIFLLFMIGREIDLKRIMSAGRAILLTSVIQFAGGAAIGVALFAGLGFAIGGGGRLRQRAAPGRGDHSGRRPAGRPVRDAGAEAGGIGREMQNRRELIP